MDIAAIELKINNEIKALAEMLIDSGSIVTTAESLTGGMIASSFVDVPGSSGWFSNGYVTYSDAAKVNMLGVDSNLIARETAVSPNVAIEMAKGALKASGANFAVAVTGLAGPGADELGRDAGLVYIGIACKFGASVREYRFSGSRREIRKKTNLEAVLSLKKIVQNFS